MIFQTKYCVKQLRTCGSLKILINLIYSYSQCFGSEVVSMRIRIRHFRSMRIQNFQIQGLDDQKLK